MLLQNTLLMVLASVLIIKTNADRIDTDEEVIATQGAVWPKPQHQNTSQEYLIIRPLSFHFELLNDIECEDFLDKALERYWVLIANTLSPFKTVKTSEESSKDNFVGYLDSLDIEITGECRKRDPNHDVRPDLGDDESYILKVLSLTSSLSTKSVWGLLRGLETFSQLIYQVDNELWINVTTITDFPRFPHRGLLLDTSRHFQPISVIFKMLDAMSYNKLNVFHWHIVDDQSFPYQSSTFPELSTKGAYHPDARIYSQNDVREVIEYARLRGIRVIPEFDTPGHTRSWGKAYPELLTSCYSGYFGPMDPSKEATFVFLRKLFTEVVEVFPDSYMHIGGDEVDFSCWLWQDNANISQFMEERHISDYSQLENYFIQKIIDILATLNCKCIVWEDVFSDGVILSKSTIVQVWKLGNEYRTLHSVTKSGYYGLFSACWYLSHLESGGDWLKFYQCDPHDFPGTPEEKKLVLGGEACMWGENINEYNVIPRVWPRASAVAERLWSDASVKNVSNAQERLEEHTCRMIHRGIHAQPPNGPGSCL